MDQQFVSSLIRVLLCIQSYATTIEVGNANSFPKSCWRQTLYVQERNAPLMILESLKSKERFTNTFDLHALKEPFTKTLNLSSPGTTVVPPRTMVNIFVLIPLCRRQHLCAVVQAQAMKLWRVS